MTTSTNSTFKSALMPYIHTLVLPIIVSIVFSNPLMGAIYLAIPTIVYSTLKKDKYVEFIIPAIIVAALLIAGWADAVKMP